MPNKTLPLTSECMNTYSGRQTHASLAFKCVVVSPLLCVHRLTTWSPAGLHYTDMWDTSSHLWHKPLHQQSVNWTVTIETMVVGRTEPWCTVFLRLLGPCCHMYRSCSPAGNKSLAMRQDAWSFIPLTLPPAPLNPLGVDLWPLASDQTKQADTPPPLCSAAPDHARCTCWALAGWMDDCKEMSHIHCQTSKETCDISVFGYMCRSCPKYIIKENNLHAKLHFLVSLVKLYWSVLFNVQGRRRSG